MLERLLNQNQQDRLETVRRFQKANRKMPPIPGPLAVEIEYDPDNDCLNIQVGQTEEPIVIFQDHLGFEVIVDAGTYEFRGVEHDGFLASVRDGKLTGTHWESVAEMVQKGHNFVLIPPKEDAEEVSKSFGDLVPA